MKNHPTHFFGIGAQKAGTTWLHEVLNSYPDCAVPPVKELHFFDIKYLSDSKNGLRMISMYKDRLGQMVQMANGFHRDLSAFWERNAIDTGKPNSTHEVYQNDYLENVNVDARLANIARLARYLRIRDIESYAAYLEEVRYLKGARVIGEFTPAYSMLPEEAFQEMSEYFPDSKFIFIMRDPVSRLLSQIRFKKKRQNAKGNTAFDPLAYFETALSSAEFLERSNYRRTIEVLERAIPSHRIQYLFFEELVSPDSVVKSMRTVENFLGLQPKTDEDILAMAEVKRNVSDAADFNSEHLIKVRRAMNDNYRFIEDHFGRMPTGWNNTPQ